MLLHYVTDDIDTRAITRRLREDGSLIGVLSTEDSKTDEELLEISRSWDIVGKHLIYFMKGPRNLAHNLALNPAGSFFRC